MRLQEEFLAEPGGKMFALEVSLWCRGMLFLFLKCKYQVQLERMLGRARTLGKAQALGMLG